MIAEKSPKLSFDNTPYLAVLVSGGRSSAMMARHIQNSSKYDHYIKKYVFCNTGHERPETIEFLKNMVRFWNIPLTLIEGVYSNVMGVGVKSKIVDFDSLDMKGKVFSEAIEHLNKNKWTGVPNPATPYCSEYLKTRPSHDFIKKAFGTTKYIKALGYRREDIPRRITLLELEEENKRIAPLLTDFNNPVGIPELDEFFNQQPFQLGIDSSIGNCELCWKKSEKNLVKAIHAGTRFIDWHKKEEEKYGNMFFRKNLSISDLVKMAKSDLEVIESDTIEDRCVCNF